MCCAADWMWYASIFSWSSAAIAWIAFKHSVPPTPFRNRRCPRKKVCHRPTAPPCVRKQQLQAGRCVDAYLDNVYLVVPRSKDLTQHSTSLHNQCVGPHLGPGGARTSPRTARHHHFGPAKRRVTTHTSNPRLASRMVPPFVVVLLSADHGGKKER